jgi:hypothetical protein
MHLLLLVVFFQWHPACSGHPAIRTHSVPRAGGDPPRKRKPRMLTGSETSIPPSPLTSARARSARSWARGCSSLAGERLLPGRPEEEVPEEPDRVGKVEIPVLVQVTGALEAAGVKHIHHHGADGIGGRVGAPRIVIHLDRYRPGAGVEVEGGGAPGIRADDDRRLVAALCAESEGDRVAGVVVCGCRHLVAPGTAAGGAGHLDSLTVRVTHVRAGRHSQGPELVAVDAVIGREDKRAIAMTNQCWTS